MSTFMLFRFLHFRALYLESFFQGHGFIYILEY